MGPLVSVVIPTFGGNRSIESAIDSVLDQNYTNFEVIVVDDNNPGSDERKTTESIMEKYRHNEKVIYIKHEKNKNGAAARNTAVAHSHGKYIAFLDDDDKFLPKKLQRQVEYLENHPEHGAVYCWRLQRASVVSSVLEGDLSEEILDLSFTPYTSAIMIRASCFNALHGFDETFRRHQDFEFLLRFFEKYTIGVVKEPLVEIIGNEVNNQPQGKKLLALKKQYLSTFLKKIEEIDVRSPGFKKYVWAVHYAAAGAKLTVKGHFFLLVQMYIQDGYKGGLLFWKLYTNHIWKVVRYQFVKLKHKKDGETV